MSTVLGVVLMLGAPGSVLVFLAVPTDVAAPLVGWAGFVAVVVAVVAALAHMLAASPAFGGRKPFGYDEGREAADEHWASREDVQRHEDGHAKLLNKYRVGVAWFGKVVYRYRGGWAGYTTPASWARFDALSPEQQIAVYHAGHVLQHNTTARSYGDENMIKYIANGDAALERRGRALAERDLRSFW